MSLDTFLVGVQDKVHNYWRDFLKNSCWHEDFKNLSLERVGHGKCLRPALIVKTYQSLQKNEFQPPEAVWKTALALEMIHTYSLVHDDLPSMDDDNFRRGLPTAHRESNEATALLLGDALLTGAFELLAQIDCESSSKIKLIQNLAHCAGGAGMVSGQQRDLFGKMSHTEDLKILHEEKTGALFAFCVWSAALLALDSATFQKSEQAYLQFGKKMGLLFQVVDDVLDVGEEGASFVGFMGLEETKKYASALHQELSEEAKNLSLHGVSSLIDRFLDRKT